MPPYSKEFNAKNINLLWRSFQSHLPLFVQQQQQEQVPYGKESVGKIVIKTITDSHHVLPMQPCKK